MESCCTCATVLSPSSPQTPRIQPLPEDRRVECCARVICGKCIQSNRRFAGYCPYCQVSTKPSPLSQRLKDPPSFTSVPFTWATTAQTSIAPPPPYSLTAIAIPSEADDEKAALVADQEKSIADDTLHFLDHDHDSIASLSLRYGVPTAALRRANNITSDHLLLGRKTLLIPGEYYTGGISLSPRPVGGEDEELRKGKIRRLMISCKISDYDVALLYLEQSGYDLAAAVESYFNDEAWEKAHPRQELGKDSVTRKGHKSRGPFWRGL
ncbi:hypothetical protein TOPH_00648 [Tolypocladium ophioglossoides CBS 100239]|uniref:LysM domain-containing protein n=1 Tax=Tolypocladium ophioglossoides (strain CBS 100239) TaxID=1163406 RepID=A0A0L0NLE9_TOLOC|nr:hypothetical protein TOPH_00648 [Tolypocladium ophioglossoides CBS 100239]